MKLTFLGATQTVTGSRYLVEAPQGRVLVDCGLFQGYKHLRLKNWATLPFNPRAIDAVLLTHAHLDHSGYLPKLIAQGFDGPVYATRATFELCRILLPDSGRLQEEQADYANRHKFSKHSPALPLYTEQDAVRCLERFQIVEFDSALLVAAGLRARWTRAGHLLGAASIRLEHGRASILFSGDLGRSNDPLLRAPAPPPAADVVVIESTYGNRAHPQLDAQEELRAAMASTLARGGVVLIPTFAVGRAQLLLWLIACLKQSGAIPDVPVYLDSPMAIDATALLKDFAVEHRLSKAGAAAVGRAATLVRTPDQSRALAQLRGPAIILAASGMATGGRVLHHLKLFAPDPANTILFGGFQAGGTRGAAMVGGAERIRIHGEAVQIRATVRQLESLSAHADCDQLIAWLRAARTRPRHVYITHGEVAASESLRVRIQEELGWSASVPEYRDAVEV